MAGGFFESLMRNKAAVEAEGGDFSKTLDAWKKAVATKLAQQEPVKQEPIRLATASGGNIAPKDIHTVPQAGNESFMQDMLRGNQEIADYKDAVNTGAMSVWENEDLAGTNTRTGAIAGEQTGMTLAEAKSFVEDSARRNNIDLNDPVWRTMNPDNNDDDYVNLGAFNYLHDATFKTGQGNFGTELGVMTEDPEMGNQSALKDFGATLGPVLTTLGAITGQPYLSAAGGGLTGYGTGDDGFLSAVLGAGSGYMSTGGGLPSISQGGSLIDNAMTIKNIAGTTQESIEQIGDYSDDNEPSMVEALLPEFFPDKGSIVWQDHDQSDVLGEVQVQVPDYSQPQEDDTQAQQDSDASGGGGQTSADTTPTTDSGGNNSEDEEHVWEYKGDGVFENTTTGETRNDQGDAEGAVVGDTYSIPDPEDTEKGDDTVEVDWSWLPKVPGDYTWDTSSGEPVLKKPDGTTTNVNDAWYEGYGMMGDLNTGGKDGGDSTGTTGQDGPGKDGSNGDSTGGTGGNVDIPNPDPTDDPEGDEPAGGPDPDGDTEPGDEPGDGGNGKGGDGDGGSLWAQIIAGEVDRIDDYKLYTAPEKKALEQIVQSLELRKTHK